VKLETYEHDIQSLQRGKEPRAIHKSITKIDGDQSRLLFLSESVPLYLCVDLVFHAADLDHGNVEVGCEL